MEYLNDENVKELIIDTVDEATVIWNAYNILKEYNIDITLTEFDDCVNTAIRELWADEYLMEKDIIEPYIVYDVEQIDPQTFIDILTEVGSEIEDCIYYRSQDYDVSDIVEIYLEMKFNQTNLSDLKEELGIENIESYDRSDLLEMFKEMYNNFGF